MVATITAVFEPVYRRVGVNLAGFVTPGPITVRRYQGTDPTAYTVRGFGSTQVSGGVAFAYDYEAPFNTALTYQATDGVTVVNSAVLTNVNRETWVRAPGQPALDQQVTVLTRPETISRNRPRTVLNPFGRTTAVALTDTLKSEEFDLKVLAWTYANADALSALLEASPTVLLLLPGLRNQWMYVSVGGFDEKPLTSNPSYTGTDGPAMVEFTLAGCVRVDSPVGGLFGDPTATYALVKSTYATYAALKAAVSSYVNVLKGV